MEYSDYTGWIISLDMELWNDAQASPANQEKGEMCIRDRHETGRVYDADLKDISQRQELLWEGVKEILTQLSKLS